MCRRPNAYLLSRKGYCRQDPLTGRWQGHLCHPIPRIGMKVERLFVRRMKTKWGSCNHNARNLLLSTELAKKPRACLEYIVVHEMAAL
ncbi:MAG: M48 family metallopeptidase [Methanosarcinaceae archaeon]|nr:M48 family metallopeptidase [Methanosarcinaceae archaeon]